MEAAASTDVEALKKLAADYSVAGDYDNAIIEYTKAIQIAPNDAELYKMRGNARFWYALYVSIYCDETEKEKAEYRLSIEDYSEAIRLNPNDDESYTECAWLYYVLNNGEEKKAIEDCDSALKINPNNADAYGTAADVCKSMGLYPLAIQWYTKALNIREAAYIYWDRGEAYEATGDSSNARADFVKAANLDPYYWGELGDLYQERGELQQAIDAYTRKINAEPDASAYIFRADAYKENGDYKKALADYSKAIELEPLDGFYYKYRADMYRELKNNEAALADYTEAIYLIAGYDFTREDSGRAIELYAKTDDKFLAELYDARGDVNDALENFDQAKSDYEKALRLDIDLALDNEEAGEPFDEIE